jgi:solute:Na+ symporter, SSS family
MQLHALDIGIIVGYFVAVITIGLWVSRKGTKDLDSYFLGGKTLPWYMLGVSDASGMFDISGTMLLVYWLFLYGVKSIWLPWVWPTFNQIFLMMFMSKWLRRSNVLTGAQWMQTRFGSDRGANLAQLSVVAFALINVIGLLAYAFKGIGKFASGILPWHFTGATSGILTDDNIYAIILMGLTAVYAIKGGMVSVVITEVMQFTILTLTAITIGIIALVKVSPDMVMRNIPAGWMSPFFGWKLNLNWDGILKTANSALSADHNRVRNDAFQGRALKPCGTRPQLRHAAHPRHAQPARGLPHEWHGERRPHVPALHDDGGARGPGAHLLHAADPGHGEAGF